MSRSRVLVGCLAVVAGLAGVSTGALAATSSRGTAAALVAKSAKAPKRCATGSAKRRAACRKAASFVRVDRISGGSFEKARRRTACFAPFGAGDGSVAATTRRPIAGRRSLSATVNPWGRVGCVVDYPYHQGPIVRAVTAEADLRVDASASGGEKLAVCAVVYYETRSTPRSTCRRYGRRRAVVHVRLRQDAHRRRVSRVFFQLSAEGAAMRATLDDAHLWVEQRRGSAGPRRGGGGSGGGSGGGGGACKAAGHAAPSGPPVAGSDCDENARPSGSSGYAPAALHLASSHPFISLDDYKGASAASAVGTRFEQYVDNNLSGAKDWGYTPADAVVMYARSGRVRYLDAAIAQVDASVRAAERAIASGDAPPVAGDDYLGVGDELEALAFAYDYGIAAGRLSDDRRRRWKAYGDQAVADVWSPSLATWGHRPAGAFAWSGWSINNPGDNYFFSFLKATELWALATRSDAWIDFLQRRKLPLLEDYYASVPGGGSREGTGYGTAQQNLYDDVRMWRTSTGERLRHVVDHARATIDYWIHATVPTLDMFASIGDLSREAMPNLFDYHENLVRQAVVLNPGTDAARRGMWWIAHNSVPNLLTQRFTLRPALMTPSDPPAAPTALVYHAPGVGQLFARSSWSRDATWMNFTAGRYDESHAHEDQGAFQFYRGTWLSATSNIFSRSGLEGNGNYDDLGSAAASVLRFEHQGRVIDQRFATDTMAVDASGGAVSAHANLSPAFAGSNGQVRRWTRDVTFQGNTLHVHDQCTVGTGVSATFQVHVPAHPVLGGGGAITAGKLRIATSPSYAVHVVDMRPLDHGAFSAGWRIDLVNPAGCAYDVDLTAGS